MIKSLKLKFYFQPPFSGWMPTSIFNSLYKYYKAIYKDQIASDDTIQYNSESGHRTSPHHLIIENIYTKKYKVITYCDYPKQILTDISGGWDNKNCLGIYACPDSAFSDQIIPSSYCAYNRDVIHYIKNKKTSFSTKNSGLCFRGYLYNERYVLSKYLNDQNIIKIFQDKLDYIKYAKELNFYQIGLSLNGIAEICNRDMEILSAESVLLRPKLVTSNFHNPLIPDFHYVTFPVLNDPRDQIDAIISIYESLQKDYDKMSYVAKNGYDWYNINGSEDGNVSVLSSIINIEELFE
jgi:hypothetical protein